MEIKSDFNDKLIFLLQQAIYIELSLTPKPGLITPESVNVHKDMDFYTMLISFSALNRYFKLLIDFIDNNIIKDIEKKLNDLTIKVNINKQKIVFQNNSSMDNNNLLKILSNLIKKTINQNYNDLLKIGIKGEKDLLNFTLNTNTYKGILYSLSLFIISVKISLFFKNHNSNYYFLNLLKTKNIIELTEIFLKILGKEIAEKKKKQLKFLNTYGAKLRNFRKIKDIIYFTSTGFKPVFTQSKKLFQKLTKYKKVKNKLKNLKKELDNILYIKNIKENFNYQIYINQLFYELKNSFILTELVYFQSIIDDSNVYGKKNLKILKTFKQLNHILYKRIIKSEKKLFFEFKKIINNNRDNFLNNLIKVILNHNYLVKNSIKRLKQYCLKHQISGGGAADFLILTIFILILKNEKILM